MKKITVQLLFTCCVSIEYMLMYENTVIKRLNLQKSEKSTFLFLSMTVKNQPILKI